MKTPEQKAIHAANERQRRADDRKWLDSLSEEERKEVKAKRSAEDRARRAKFKATLSEEEVLRRKQETAEYDAVKYQKDKEAFAKLPVEEQIRIRSEQQVKRRALWLKNGEKYKQQQKDRVAAMPEQERQIFLQLRKEYQDAYREKNRESILEKNRRLQQEKGHIYRENRKAKIISLSPEEQERIRQEQIDYHRAYYEANRDRILANKKEYYYENQDEILVKKQAYYLENRDARIAYNRAYYEANAEYMNEQGRKWYEANHERALATAKAYRTNNPEKVRACEKACDANRRAAFGKITTADIQDAIACSEGRCPYCIKELVFGDIHIDHCIPLSRGGSNTRENIVACCAECNLRKNDKTP